jgi:hypothetical protein
MQTRVGAVSETRAGRFAPGLEIVQLRTAVWTGVTRDTRPISDIGCAPRQCTPPSTYRAFPSARLRTVSGSVAFGGLSGSGATLR